MRGLNIVVFVCCLAIGINAVPIMFPGYNDGNGLPQSPGTENFISKISTWSLAGLSDQFSKFGNGGVLDLAALSVTLILMTIYGAIMILSVMVYALPILQTVGPFIPTQILEGIQLVIWIAEVVAIIQVARGIPWGLNE